MNRIKAGRLLRTKAGRVPALLLAAWFMLLPAGTAWADKIVDMTASVDAQEIGMEDTLTLTVTVETENVSRINKPEVEKISAFKIINESSSSQTSISIINGKTTRSKTITFTYVLEPHAMGTFTIGPVVLTYDKKKYKTQQIDVAVVEGRVKEIQTGPGGVPVDLEALREDMFIKVTPSKTEVFKGEQVFLTYKLYSRLDIDSVSLKQNPDFPGFYREEVFNATRLEYRKEALEERMYTTSVLKKVALFPLDSGTFTPKPLVLETTVILKSRDLFEAFGVPYTFTVRSEPIELTVKPLPATTSTFSGLVGRLQADLMVPDNDTQTGESVLCYLTLRGTGNLSVITEPSLKLSLKGRTYLSDTLHNTVENDDGISFVKKFEYTIIPEERGRLVIDGPDFLFFDTEAGNYVLTGPESVQISVSGENIVREQPIRESPGAQITGGLRFIKQDMKAMGTVFQPLRSTLFYALHIGLLLAAVVLFAFRVKKEKLQRNVDLQKRKRARSTALRSLARTSRMIQESRYNEALDSLDRTLRSYLADKSGRRIQEVSHRDAGRILRQIPGMTPEMENRVAALLGTFSELKYSSGTGRTENSSVEALHHKVAGAVHDLEKLR
jgi:uncharacterized FlaG/YvyC family protein